MPSTDYAAMRAELMRKTVKELRAIARSEGICLGYDGSTKRAMANEIAEWRRHREKEAD